MTRLPRDFSPVPGTGRCELCGEPDNAAHVPHPWTDKVIWLWRGHTSWKVIIIATVWFLVVALATVITVIRSAYGI